MAHPDAPTATAAPVDLRRFVDSLGDGVYGIDLEGHCLFVNSSALRTLRYDRPEDLLGRNMHDVIHHTRSDGSDFPRQDCSLLRTSRSGLPVELESETLWRSDGTSLLAEYSAFPVFEDGRIVGSVITFRENTVRLGAAVRLAVQQSVSQVLAGSAGLDAMMGGVLETVGRGFGWDCGVFWTAHPGAPLAPAASWTLPGRAASPDPPPGEALARQARATAEPLHAPAAALEPSARDAGLQAAIAFPVGPGTDPSGAIVFYAREPFEADDGLLEALRVLGGMIGQGTERRRAAAALRASETRFRVIAETVPQLSWTADTNGEITWFNQRWYDFTGTTFDRMAGHGWKSVHHPDHIGRVERSLQRSFATGEEWEDTFPLRAADGSYRWFLSRAVPILLDAEDPAGRSVVGWFGTNTDITAMRVAEQTQARALDEAEANSLAKSLFLANMSHELRTPLSAIIGYTEMLVEEVEDGASPAELQRDLGKVETNARHLLGLINDVLDLSKVESGKMELYAERFEVAALVRDVAATIGALVTRNGNALELRLAADLGAMESDVTRIRQILLNLLGNAAKFTQAGRITLTVARDFASDGTARIAFGVADTGVGMTPDQLAKLFGRFQQADISTTRRFGGTGLGLALTKSFAQMLGGDVDVRSEPGRGSVFTVTLPAERPTPPRPDPAPVADPGDRRTVLVIDDDPLHCDLTARFLDRAGFHARIAADGRTGLALARELHPYAILLDVTMPGTDGWSVLGALKSDPALAAIPVVMVTVVDERPLASALGAADYLAKPVDWDRLRVALDRFRDAEGDVLVVDDDADTRQRLRRLLEANDWSVSEAADGQETLAHVEHAVPRLILLDLAMPVMDGFEFFEQLRRRPACGTVPVVVLTAMDLTLDDRRRLRGATQILNKGTTSLNELMDKLRHIEAFA